MFKIKMLCYDADPTVKPYWDEPEGNNYFDTKDETLDKAYELADQEVENLNDGCLKEVSFGVVVDEDEDTVTVNYYYAEEDDYTGNTETVTVYYVVEA